MNRVTGCADVDLGFTPVTNLIAIRRLHLKVSFAHMFKLIGGPESIEGKSRTAFLSAISAVANADAKGFSANGNLYLPKKAFPEITVMADAYPV